MTNIIYVFAILILSACGKTPAPSIQETIEPVSLPESEITTPDPVVTVTPSPEPSVNPSPSPTPTPTLKIFTYNQYTQICNAMRAWNPDTTTIQINFTYSNYYYTFSKAEGVTATQNGATQIVSEDVMLEGQIPSNPVCTIRILDGVLLSVL